MFIYAGIGSRETPPAVIDAMTYLAEKICELPVPVILRSGGAEGADQAFEAGHTKEKEIYLPWKNFENNKSSLYGICARAETFGKTYHPNWFGLSEGIKKLHGRNAYQVLGKTLEKPATVIICYTTGGKIKGGTGQALRIAKAHQVPVLNFGAYLKEHTPREIADYFLVQIERMLGLSV